MQGQQIPVNLLFWLVALLPIASILVLLVGLRWKAVSAAPVGYFLAVLAAVFLFQTSLETVGLQTVKGVWDAVFIVYVIVPALLLFQVSRAAGAFDALRAGIESYTPNDLLHVLAFGWVFSSFLQGITGFGAPVAVTAPLLVAVGVQPLWAVIIPLIGHAWANTFGTLAVAWEGLRLVVDLGNPDLAAMIAAVMLLLANLLAGLAIAWLYGRMDGVREGLPAILLIGAIHGIGQLALVTFIPTLSNFLPGAVAVGAVLVLARTGWYSGPSRVENSPIMGPPREPEGGEWSQEGAKTAEPQMPLALALAPYGVLVFLIMGVLLIPFIENALSAFELGLPFPRMETGYGVVTEATNAYSQFSPLTHPGTFLLAAAVVAYVLFKSRGHIQDESLGSILGSTVRTSIPTTIAVLTLISLAKVLEGSGQVLVLALGIAAVAPPPVYVALSPFIGLLGAFTAASNLSSNILFGPLQESTANALDLPAEVVVAGQTAGGAVGNSIAPGNVLLGLGAVGIVGRSGEVIRHTIIYSMAAAGLASLVALAAVPLVSGG